MQDLMVNIRANNGKYVCALDGGALNGGAPGHGGIVVNRTLPLGWETFYLKTANGFPLTDGSPVVLKTSDWSYVSNSGEPAPLAARYINSGPPSASEVFTLSVQPATIYGPAAITLRTTSNPLLYVCAEGGGEGQLIANRPGPDDCETFTLDFLSPFSVLTSALEYQLVHLDKLAEGAEFLLPPLAVVLNWQIKSLEQGLGVVVERKEQVPREDTARKPFRVYARLGLTQYFVDPSVRPGWKYSYRIRTQLDEAHNDYSNEVEFVIPGELATTYERQHSPK